MEENRLKELLAGANLTLNGSQINLGGENTIINNYYRQEDAPSVDGKADKGDFAPSAKERLCESLSTDRAREEFAKFQKAGMLDENYQPIHLTRPQMGCIVIRMSAVLGLASQWKDFGRLWDIDSELLRTQFAKGQDSEPTREFNRILLSL